MRKKGTLFIISAPSGAGKTTLVHALLAELKSKHTIDRVVTYTTKAPRQGEVPGADYHFVSKELFEARAKEGFFLEWSTDYISYYGTPADIREVLAEGRSLVLIIDRRGAQQVMAHMPEVVMIWIYTRNLQELEARLRKRGTETEALIAHRIARARIEIEAERKAPLYPHHILNDEFEVAVTHLKQLMMREMN